ncbi:MULTISPECIES: STAS domain-containing protein [unclassified Aureispira]|uniref:STAS domain-containing protein n=1 Tax=unclassified Aureispira TaxID=2649989 RepID=UPI00069924F6|nr:MULTISPECIES: STAS domain-containing protein [unclassified Aureispira]WMX15695.1 STAS domain-containing protein [Aureispira sp. CCB-E]
MAYTFLEKNGVQILQVDNLLNPLDNQEIIRAIEEKIEASYTEFIVDLEQMDFMNSTGLTFLISILTRSRSAGGDVAIANLSDNIKKILLVTRLNSAFSVFENVDDALTLFIKENKNDKNYVNE